MSDFLLTLAVLIVGGAVAAVAVIGALFSLIFILWCMSIAAADIFSFYFSPNEKDDHR